MGKAMVELLKGVLKLTIVGVVLTMVVMPELTRITELFAVSIPDQLLYTAKLSGKVLALGGTTSISSKKDCAPCLNRANTEIDRGGDFFKQIAIFCDFRKFGVGLFKGVFNV